MKIYYRRQHHKSAQDFLKHHLRIDGFSGIGQLLQVTVILYETFGGPVRNFETH